MISIDFNKTLKKINDITPYISEGKVKKVIGLTIEVEGLKAAVGELCTIYNQSNNPIDCEVVGFKENEIILMPLNELVGIGPGCRVVASGNPCSVKCSDELLGKVIDALGAPIDESVVTGGERYSMFNKPPDPMKRKRIKNIMPTGIKAIDGFITCGEGQRVGIFAGSGVGKSTTLGMIAKTAEADVNVIALIGERGREVLDFIERDLGPEGMKKSVVVCATSDKPPLVRLKGALTATSIAEYFRDMGYSVALMADSTSRWAEALREMSGRLEEMPGEEGYPAYLGSRLAQFYERAGDVVTLGKEGREGALSVIGAVSPPGGDISEPVSQATLRIVKVFWGLDSNLAYKRHFPAINWLTSYSLYADSLGKWFNENVDKDWTNMRTRIMGILSDEASLDEIVKLVGMDALSPSDRLKMEAARSIREDFLHQLAFHEIDTYTSLKKQCFMMKLMLMYYDRSLDALNKGADIEKIAALPVREAIGRFKYVKEEDIDKEFAEIDERLSSELAEAEKEGEDD